MARSAWGFRLACHVSCATTSQKMPALYSSPGCLTGCHREGAHGAWSSFLPSYKHTGITCCIFLFLPLVGILMSPAERRQQLWTQAEPLHQACASGLQSTLPGANTITVVRISQSQGITFLIAVTNCLTEIT